MTRDYTHQALRALTVYVERGERILLSIERGNTSRLDGLLRRRSAAFNNYKVADQIELEAGKDTASLPAMIALFKRAQEIDAKIEAFIQTELEESEKELRRIALAKSNVRKYHTGSNYSAGFVQAV